MRGVGPKQSASQRRGVAAETAFAASVARRAHLWHPISAGNDFGVDGWVELIEPDGSVTGIEFGAQVKGVQRFPEAIDGAVPVASVKVSTAAYWLSRLTPTLVVAWEEETGQFMTEWAHEIVPPERLLEALAAAQQTLTLRIPAVNELSASGWADIETTARKLHSRAIEALAAKHVMEIYQTLLCRVADVRDVLVEWVMWLAYDSPEALAKKFASTDEDSARWLDAFESLRLSPPRFGGIPAIQAAAALCFPVHALCVVVAGVLYTNTAVWHIPAENPVVSSVVSFNAALDSYYKTIFVVEDQAKALAYGSAYDSSTMATLRFWEERLVVVLGLIVLLIRDFERDLRRWLFPHAEREPDIRSRAIRDMAKELVTPTAEWHQGWGRGEPSTEKESRG